MNRLALGTAQFGMQYGIANTKGQVTEKEAQEIVSVAKLNNIDTIDTAINYNESEGCLGNISVRDFKMILNFRLCRHGFRILVNGFINKLRLL